MKLKVPAALTFLLLLTSSSLFAQWTRITNAGSGNVDELEFPTAQTGYAITSGQVFNAKDTLFKTTDGGMSWSAITPPSASNTFLRDISFPHPDTGVVAYGNNNGMSVAMTQDGGQTWNTISPPFTKTNAYSLRISFSNSQNGYCGTDQYIFKTTNGGTSWTLDSLKNQFFYPLLEDLDFFDANHGYLVTWDGTFNYSGDIFSTTDGGQTWSKDTLAWTQSQPTSVQALSQTNGYVLSPGNALVANPRIMETTNNGTRWDSLIITPLAGVFDDARDFYFSTPDSGWVITSQGRVFQTTDGGQSWRLQDSLARYLISITFAGNKGYIGADEGKVFEYTLPVSTTPALPQPSIVKTWPGPFRETLNLEITQAQTAIRIYDLTGKTKWMQSSLSPGRHAISTKDFAPGIYLLRATPENGNNTLPYTQKLIKR